MNEEQYLYYVIGEIDGLVYIEGEVVISESSEEEADDVFYNSSVRKLLQRGLTLDESTINECTEELIDMTMREALQRGLYLD